MSVRNFEHLFRPRSIAVVGATPRPGSVGAVVMRNLLAAGFAGPILPVNPHRGSVAGVLAYPDVERLPLAPDLAVICTPPAAVAGVVGALGQRGTRAAIVLTALGRERGTGSAWAALQDAARQSGMRILGPNCIGLIAPHAGLDASFAHVPARTGSLAFVSQSGAMCTAVLDWARAAGIGFSCFVSLGDALDVDSGDLIDWLGADPATSAILLYLESISHARKFLSAARAAGRNKPLVAIKAGRAREGARAAASHTGALAGADEVVDCALARAGILRVDDIDGLFAAVATLAWARPLAGERLAIVTNGGGAGVVATDAFVRGGGRLAQLEPATIERLDAQLPAAWSRGNPVDIIGDAPAARFRGAVQAAAEDPGVDAVLVLQAPTAVVDSVAAAEAVVEAAGATHKPVLCCWLGGAAGATLAARQRFAAARLPSYETPGDAVRAFLQLVERRRKRELLLALPSAPAADRSGDPAAARAAVAAALDAGAEWLDDGAVRRLLGAFGVPMVAAREVADDEAAVRAADELGYPVAVKVRSPDVLHKTDVGGVALDLGSAAAVREATAGMRERLRGLQPAARLQGWLVQRMVRRPRAHELLVGAAVDPVFGPFVMFGRGGIAVEVIADKAVALPPLDDRLARELIARTRVARLLQGYRGRPAADLAAVADVLIRVAQLVAEVPEVIELDLNPLLADEEGAVALDARVRVERAAGGSADRLAIRPYPQELAEEWTLADGRRVEVRPIRPEDEEAHAELFASFPPADVRFRFFALVREMPHSQLARYTQIDYDREMAFVAVEPGGRELGVVRAVASASAERAEFAIIVRPEAKGLGLGRRLLDKMVRYCRDRGTRELVGRVLRDNRAMLSLARAMGFQVHGPPEGAGEGDGEVEVRLALD